MTSISTVTQFLVLSEVDVDRESKVQVNGLLFGFRAVRDPYGRTASPFSHLRPRSVKTFEPDQVAEQGEGELRRDATIGQITMLTASSFCGPYGGPYGALWGYDVARPPSWRHPRGAVHGRRTGDQFDPERRERILNGLPRVSGARLANVAEYLFGHNNDNYRHPPPPGSMVTRANKSKSLLGPTTHIGGNPVVRGSDKSQVG